MKLEAILTLAYVIVAFGGFSSVVIWALRQAGPDFPPEPQMPSQALRRELPPAPAKRAA